VKRAKVVSFGILAPAETDKHRIFWKLSSYDARLTTENSPDALRHREKTAKRKAVQGAEAVSKTIAEKDLLIVHTGPGNGKSTAAFGLVLRPLGHGWRCGIVQFIRGAWDRRSRRITRRTSFSRFSKTTSRDLAAL
jgi:hypothetical protein